MTSNKAHPITTVFVSRPAGQGDRKMTTFAIATDAVTTRVDAANADEAARKFAAGEKLYAGCTTAAEVQERAEELGGWCEINELS